MQTIMINENKYNVEDIKREVSVENTEEAYNDYLYEMYGQDVAIAGHSYDLVHALKQVDRIAYRCGKTDWEDSQFGSSNDYVEIDGDYYRTADVERWCDIVE